MAPPRGSERTGKEGAWVKKGNGGAAEKTGDASDDEEEKGLPRNERREAGRGRGRQPREPRGRREPREKEGAVGAAAPEEGAEGRGTATRGRGGRAQRGSRRGSAQEPAADDKENTNTDEAGEELNGSALLNMLKANPPKVIRYTKGELLSISQLPASNVKPPDLSVLIDKENKESQLLIRMTGSRPLGPGDAEDGGGDGATARRERRERRSERREPEHGGGEDAEASRGFNNDWYDRKKNQSNSGQSGASPGSGQQGLLSPSDGKQPDLSTLIDKDKDQLLHHRQLGAGDAEDGVADMAAARRDRRDRRAERRGTGASEDMEVPEDVRTRRGGGAPSSPNRGRTTPANSNAGPDKLLSGTKTNIFVEEDDVDVKASRAFNNWFDRKKIDQPAPGSSTAAVGASTHASGIGAGAAAAGQSGTTPTPGQQGFPASYLQQQAHTSAQMQASLGQAQQAMQAQAAAAYMQYAAAHAAASRGAYGGALPWGYNPYLFPYPPYGAYPPLDSNMPQQQAMQAKLAAAAAAGSLGTVPGAGSLGMGSLNAAHGQYGASASLAGSGRSAGAGAGTGAGTAANKAASNKFPTTTTPASPQLTRSLASPPLGKKPPPLEPVPAAPLTEVQAPSKTEFFSQTTTASKDDAVDGEEEAGCSQS